MTKVRKFIPRSIETGQKYQVAKFSWHDFVASVIWAVSDWFGMSRY